MPLSANRVHELVPLPDPKGLGVNVKEIGDDPYGIHWHVFTDDQAGHLLLDSWTPPRHILYVLIAFVNNFSRICRCVIMVVLR
jgi:hypothetical protein